MKRNADVSASIGRALEEDNTAAKTISTGPQPQPSQLSERSTPVPQKPNWSPTTVPAAHPDSSRTLSQSSNPQDLPSTIQRVSSSVSMASIARAVSPGPAELGFHVTPSSSSPEELIAALGPLPAPMQFASGHASGKRGGNGAQRKKPRKRDPESSTATANIQLGSIRPQSHFTPPSNTNMGRVIEYVDTLNSYASSPGSMIEGTSPSSSESNSRRSSEEDKSAANVVRVGQSAFTTGLPHSAFTTDFQPISVMPPPPRPAMSLKDLCSMPAGPMARP